MQPSGGFERGGHPPVNRTGATVKLLELQAARRAAGGTAAALDRELRYRVVDEHPHDSGAFTQGLEYLAGRLVESTGIRSSLPRTKWTRRVPHPVLIGHAASLTPGRGRGGRAAVAR